MPAGYDGEKFSTHSKDFNCLKFAIEALCSREKRFFTDDATDDLGVNGTWSVTLSIDSC